MNILLRSLLAAYDFVVFYTGMLAFGMICLIWTLFAVLLQPLLPQRLGQRLGRWVISTIFRCFLAALQCSGRFHFDLEALKGLRQERALIIAANHPSLWDAVLLAAHLPNVVCVMKAQIINNIFLGAGARLAGYIRNTSLRQMIKQAVTELEQGSNILLFPEGTRTVSPPLNPLKGSIGAIARRARTPVQTVFIETDSPFLTKGWPVHRKPQLPVAYRVRLGRRFEAGDGGSALVSVMEEHFRQEIGSVAEARRPAESAPADLGDAPPAPFSATPPR